MTNNKWQMERNEQMGAFLKLKQALEEKKSFILICHVEPDGDAVGSMLAIKEYLESRDCLVAAVCRDKTPKVLNFLSGIGEIKQELPDFKPEAVILLDNGDFKRTGFQEEILRLKDQGVSIINIDHHPKNDLWKLVTINYADDQASSACEIVYRILTGLKHTLNSSLATKILAGIYLDTGGFRHPNTSDTVLGIVSELLKRGAKLKKISENMENSRPISMFRLWGIALKRLYFNEELGISVSVITAADLAETGASEEEISGLVNLLNSAPESRASLLLYETKDAKIKGSLRTDRDDVDLSKLAHYLGGGGHRKAAGFTISGRIEIVGDKWRVL